MVGSLRGHKVRRTWVLTCLFVVAVLAAPSGAHAGEWWKRLCAKVERICMTVVGRKKSMHPFYSPHYGYYPNVWRSWPADWEDWRQRYNSLQGVKPVSVETGTEEESEEVSEPTIMETVEPAAPQAAPQQ